MQEIKIMIDKEGNAKIETEGFVGGACENTVNELVLAVNGSEESSRYKDEFFSDDPNFNELANMGNQ